MSLDLSTSGTFSVVQAICSEMRLAPNWKDGRNPARFNFCAGMSMWNKVDIDCYANGLKWRGEVLEKTGMEFWERMRLEG